MSNISCRPFYIQDSYHELPNCTDVELINSINRNLDLENTFSKFKSYHTKPCANFALTYQQKIENKKQIVKTVLIEGKNVTLYNIDLEFWIIFLMDEIKLVKQVQAYPLWSFGAELGGYIGMFLGISLMQVKRQHNTYVLKPWSI